MAVFADTFYWAFLTSIEDMLHARALAFSHNLQPDEIITTDEVLIEYLAFFSTGSEYLRRRATGNVHDIFRSRVRVIPQSRESFLDGLELYAARPDKGYSLTDCISMQTMRREGLSEILTNDRHFEQEGFRALFRDS